MSKGIYNVPKAVNEAVKSYAAGSSERKELLSTYKEMYNSKVDVPLYIGSEQVFTDDKRDLHPPHDHQHCIGTANYGTEKEVTRAIEAALDRSS